MDRFLSNTINRVDAKGRVSIPAPFRTKLAGRPTLHVILDTDRPVANAGGDELLQWAESRLAKIDPFSEAYEFWAFHYMGNADELKIDPEGRIVLTPNILEHTGIEREVVFVGMGNSFQMWEPSRFQEYKVMALSRVREMRRELGDDSSAMSPARTAPPGVRAGNPRNGQEDT